MSNDENYKPLVALIVLAVVALVATIVTFANMACPPINATKPPAAKYLSNDTTVAGGQYVEAGYYYDSAGGINFTRISIWLVNATKLPVAKHLDDDVDGAYVKAGYYYDDIRGLNITRISITGFAGDPAEYTSIVKLCNKHSSAPITAYLVWSGPVTTTSHEQYIRAFLVKGPDGKGVGFVGNTTYTTAGPYTISPGGCLDIGAYVLIDPNLPSGAANGRTVLGQYQVDIVMSPS